MKYNCIIGIDPGISGACAIYFPSYPEMISCYDMPIEGKTVNGYELSKIIHQYKPNICFIENVHSFKGQGVASSFNFGCSFGMARGVVAAHSIPTILVSPQKWKKEFLLSKDKNKSLEMARSIWPNSDKFKLKKHDGRAEAALIALYGSKQL